MSEVLEATGREVARRTALQAPSGWSALIVSGLALSAEAAHVRDAMREHGLNPRRILVDRTFRDLRAENAAGERATSVFEVGDSAGDDVWRLLDWGRTRLGARSALVVLTERAAESMQRQAPHLASWFGGVWRAPLQEQVEALVRAGRMVEARQLAAEGSREELGHLADVIAPPTTSLRPATGREDLFDNARWLRKHREEFAGKWVALRGGECVDSDSSLVALHARLALREDRGELFLIQVEG